MSFHDDMHEMCVNQKKIQKIKVDTRTDCNR